MIFRRGVKEGFKVNYTKELYTFNEILDLYIKIMDNYTISCYKFYGTYNYVVYINAKKGTYEYPQRLEYYTLESDDNFKEKFNTQLNKRKRLYNIEKLLNKC